MHDKTNQLGPLVSARAGLLITVGIAVILLAAFLVAPAFSGYHFGYNWATDHECLTRLGLQWCR